MSEADHIRQIQGVVGLIDRFSPKIRLAIGDDAAAFRPSPGSLILLSMDALVEGSHFDLQYFTPEDLGWKALAVNLSDIAAMGGQPLCFATSISIRKAGSLQFVRKLYRGMMDLADRLGVALVGGDTCVSPHALFLDLTAIGEVKETDLVRRCGAQPGDFLYVSGELGGSAMGLELLRNRRLRTCASHYPDLVRRHLRPVPRCEIGRLLARRHLASSMIDLSDGLSTDLHHLCESSQVGAVIDASMIPVASVPGQRQPLLRKSPLHYAMNGGEDYELLFTVPAGLRRKVPSGVGGIPLHEIGVITRENGKCLLRDQGKLKRFSAGGFDHFAVD
ncbi:MAG TPA: thiamine-phosphate kinase [Terriglobia bacterium]|nr:thiamine-phosphate kinase [Terriglobia bacterium]